MPAKTLASMLDWIEQHLDEPITLTQVASHFGYSPYYCSAQLHTHLQMPFRIYLTTRRLAQAANRLTETNESVLHIALRYGFSSSEAFSRAFRRLYGYTPSGYRKATRLCMGRCFPQ